jgi:hypothetical protein
VLTLNVLSVTYPESRNARPGRMFGAGMTVKVYDVSGLVIDTLDVVSVTDTTVTLTAPPVFVIKNNVDFITAGDGYAGGAGTSDNGYTPTDFIYQIEDNEFIYEDAGESVTRWR